nr:ferritin-like domain-containing protein [Lysobacter sp. CAU 1642]
MLAGDPLEKSAAAGALVSDWQAGRLSLDAQRALEPVDAPGRPARPELVPVRQVPHRGLGSAEGRAAFLHAIAHIEFNAINLATDAMARFPGMPEDYYTDWLSVAGDEARHFTMLVKRLAELGYAYGDFVAHNGLWDMAAKTAHSCLARMALVPRVLEARGLDVTPGMIERLRGLGDEASASILEVILAEEIGHVAVGSRWFGWLCAQQGVPPRRTFIGLVREHARGALRGPFNRPARRDAGFDDDELDQLEVLAGAPAR